MMLIIGQGSWQDSSRAKASLFFRSKFYADPLLAHTHSPRQPVTAPRMAARAQVQLTEDETEYCVVATKHIFDSAVVFQFTCTNTVAEQVLENVTVAMDLAEAVSRQALIPKPRLLSRRGGNLRPGYSPAGVERFEVLATCAVEDAKSTAAM